MLNLQKLKTLENGEKEQESDTHKRKKKKSTVSAPFSCSISWFCCCQNICSCWCCICGFPCPCICTKRKPKCLTNSPPLHHHLHRLKRPTLIHPPPTLPQLPISKYLTKATDDLNVHLLNTRTPAPHDYCNQSHLLQTLKNHRTNPFRGVSRRGFFPHLKLGVLETLLRRGGHAGLRIGRGHRVLVRVRRHRSEAFCNEVPALARLNGTHMERCMYGSMTMASAYPRRP